jgi:hypothetical protein
VLGRTEVLIYWLESLLHKSKAHRFDASALPCVRRLMGNDLVYAS